MRKKKTYSHVRFTPETIRAAWTELEQYASDEEAIQESATYTVEVDGARWSHDTEDEFFADYRRSSGYARFLRRRGDVDLDIDVFTGSTDIAISAPERSAIESAFHVFESQVEDSVVPREDRPEPTVFIGHGQSQQWRDLKDHLRDKHGIAVEAYELGARAGHAIRDILEDMLENSSFGVLVMTAEDETEEGTFRARQNVIHEAGLFQGRLGFSRAIVVLEEGTEDFSNISGIQQIRYSKGNIKETFGEILATLRREFKISAV